MDIKEILDMLGLDFSNSDVKRGAVEAIEAILSSRIPPESMGSGNGSGSGEIDVEIDPDLIQPSQKHQLHDVQDDIEINDEDNILDAVKHNESEDEFDSGYSDDDDTSDSDNSDTLTGDNVDSEDSNEPYDETDEIDNISDTDETETSNDENTDNSDSDDSAKKSSNENEIDQDTGVESDNSNDMSDTENSGDKEENDDDYEFDEDDFLDDELKGVYDDKEQKSKHEARRIKRERTLLAAKRALENAQTRHVNPSLIRELEKSIEALESLQEAIKNIKDLSDEEFDLMINRVLDAIDSVGNSELTVKSAEEKALQAKEIKADLENTKTRNELSAEDAAIIRAETQAIKAREKETNKYKTRSASSFKGFQDFLNSLYRAVALQVKVNEVQDDSWSAISRRNSGVGVLKQGKKINELPDTKIPVIDFYFDCSGSWGAKDIQIGKKAVAALADMEEQGQIKINLYYFGDYVDTDPSNTGGGTSGWNEIVKNVIATNATNVIIMTDSDMEDWWKGASPLSYTVPGYVWYLWRNGENAPRLPRDLKGRGGTQQFSFSHSDM